MDENKENLGILLSDIICCHVSLYLSSVIPSSIIWSALQTLSFLFNITVQVSLSADSNDESYEDVSYDVEILFTSLSVQETLDYIIQKIYILKEIKPFC